MDQLVCPICALTQFVPVRGQCRRCGTRLFTLVEIPLLDGAACVDAARFGATLKAIRQAQHKTQGCISSTNRSQLSRLESGALSPRLHTVIRILRALRVGAVILRVQTPPCSCR